MNGADQQMPVMTDVMRAQLVPPARQTLADCMLIWLGKNPHTAEHPFNQHIPALQALSSATPVRIAVSTWARARRSWSAVTGEPLV